MTTFGHIDPFDEKVESWPQYAERLIQYFAANDVLTEDKKRAVFLTVLGPSAYGLLRSLVSPAKLTEKSFEELLLTLNNHFSPVPSEIVERFRFNSRHREAGESVATFVSELRKLAEHCNFGNTLEQMLRDRLVCGIQDDQTQKRLLAEPSLTLDKALKLALAIESATRDARDLNVGQNFTLQSSSESVHKVKNSPSTYRNKPKFVQQTFRNTSVKPRLNTEFGAQTPKLLNCIRCGRPDHSPKVCPFINAVCHSCGKIGHLSKVCLSTKSKTSGSVPRGSFPQKIHTVQHQVEKRNAEMAATREEHSARTSDYNLFHIANSIPKAPEPLYVNLQVNNKDVHMELDTGAAFTMMSEESYLRIFGNSLPLGDSNIALRSFSGHPIEVLGTINVQVCYRSNEAILPLLIFAGFGPTLCGRNWIFSSLNLLQMQSVHHTKSSQPLLVRILEKHKHVFSEELGHHKDIKIHLDVKENATPKFCKARSVPYAYRDLVEDELDRLQKLGILRSVPYSEFASPIVPVLKKDKRSVRICGDFKIAVNPVLNTEKYPLPRTEDVFANLAGGVKFSKLDLKDAFLQLSLDEESRKVVVINTQKGLFEYTCLPFGISSAPAIFQRVMETTLQGVPGTAVFQDDVVVTGPDDESHLHNLDEALTRIEEAGLKLKKEKCSFLKTLLSIWDTCLMLQGYTLRKRKWQP